MYNLLTVRVYNLSKFNPLIATRKKVKKFNVLMKNVGLFFEIVK